MFSDDDTTRKSDTPKDESVEVANDDGIGHSTEKAMNGVDPMSNAMHSDNCQNGSGDIADGANRKRGSKRKTKRRKHQRKDTGGDKSNGTSTPSNGTTIKKAIAPHRSYASKRKRNGRLVRLASIETNKKTQEETPATKSMPSTTSVPSLPRNQYTTTLRRRAIRKLKGSDASPDDDHGDISLGIKLIVAGGRVIVQSLNSLTAGLASPAQLVGIIQRGDVLLAIGNLSLSNLPVDQLMEGLKPLSTPDAGGCYERFLTLRFEAGAGLGLLKIHEEEHTRAKDNLASDPMFSLFPMVDHLSGVPLFEPEYNIQTYQNDKLIDDSVDIAEESKDKFPGDDNNLLEEKLYNEGTDKYPLTLDSLISSTLAKERNSDRERFQSGYFDWREDFSVLMRKAHRIVEDDDGVQRLTKKERVALGLKIMEVTKALELNMEEIDKGRDIGSHKNISSSISIRSGSSATFKRQYNMDGTITSIRSTAIDEESIDSDGSLDVVDSDQLLLSLAARDTIWRKQVISVLTKAIDEVENPGEKKSENAVPHSGDMDLRKQLGYFLFRENANRVPKRELKSVSFPPQEVTQVLFDLATYIVSTVTDDFTVFGAGSKLSSNISSFRSGATRTGGRGRASLRADILLAKHFVLDEALPEWLKTFKPLKLEQRTLLWPRQSKRMDSIAGTYSNSVNRSEHTGRSSDGDSMTIDSGGSRTQISVAESKRKDFRSDYQVVDQESRPEPETCFLVTYFYTQTIVGSKEGEAQRKANHNSFVEQYGAYLQLHTCLTFAASVQDKIAIQAVLKAARNDVNHRDVIKEIQKSNGLLFYESGKLSAVLQCLEDVRFEMNEDRRNVIRDLCVSAFPDVQPWQVRDACLLFSQSRPHEHRDQCPDDIMEGLYNSYLSHLLNPIDGHDPARQNLDLVKEFCERTISAISKNDSDSTCLENFMNIASPSSIHTRRYRRDLIMLLDLSMTIDSHDLALDLVDEILENKKLLANKVALSRALYCLGNIASVALSLCSIPAKETVGFETLRRILKLFEKMASSDSDVCQKAINFPDELVRLFKQWQVINESDGDEQNILILVDFVIDVSSRPCDVVRALMFWADSNCIRNSLYSRLEDLLCRGIQFAALNGEVSGTLLRLKHARTTFIELDSNDSNLTRKANPSAIGAIWESMATGSLSIEK